MLIGDQSLIKEYDKRSIVPRSIANGDTSSALFFEARQTQYASTLRSTRRYQKWPLSVYRVAKRVSEFSSAYKFHPQPKP